MTTTIETTVRPADRRWSGEVTTQRDRSGQPVWPIFQGVTLAEAIADRKAGMAVRQRMGVGYWSRLTVDGMAIDAAWDEDPAEPSCPETDGGAACQPDSWRDGRCDRHRVPLTSGREHIGWVSPQAAAWLAESQGRVRLRLRIDEDGGLLTAPQAAERLGVSPGRVRQLAVARGVGKRVGRDWIFTEADLAAMTDRRPGRPPQTS